MMRKICPSWVIPLVLCCIGAATASASNSEVFVRPAQLEPDIAFWRMIYTAVGTDGGVLHDPEDLRVVYETMKFPAGLSPRERSRRIDEGKKKYRQILDRIAAGKSDLSGEEQRVKALWPEDTRHSRFAEAADDVRFQLGQSDRFREGLVRSGAYRDHIAATFEKAGLPRELAALPHVESSFNTYAYSKVGAAGMWQFMRATGRRFMRIDSVVDERLDPYRATDAAVKFLEQNYIVLESWPLALTAYNHGTAGMRRAKEAMGTSDIVTIVRKYSSRTFGFASRNFYVAFLAALEIDADPTKFFPGLKRAPVDSSRIVTLPAYLPASQVTKALEIESDVLRHLNPSLLPAVWNGSKHMPRGFGLRVPAALDLSAAVQQIAGVRTFDTQVVDTKHRVRRGETLSGIAARYGVGMSRVAAINGLRRPYTLRVGQVLELPIPAGSAPPAAVAQVAREEKEEPVAAPPTGVQGAEKYVVKRGDTLSRIAQRHGMSEDALMELNSLRNRNFVYEGQVLALAESARVAPPAEAEVPVDNVVAEEPEEELVAQAVEAESPVQAEEDSPTLVPGMEAAASADPADYSVHSDNTVLVQAAETLGHYAEWLDIRASQLRRVNRMSYGTPVVVGRKIKLDFSRVKPEQFEARRIVYHKQLQEAFFTEFRISGKETHVIRSGESIWVLAQQRYNIPIWLLRQYNPDLDLGSVHPGAKLIIPTVEPVSGSGASS